MAGTSLSMNTGSIVGNQEEVDRCLVSLEKIFDFLFQNRMEGVCKQ